MIPNWLSFALSEVVLKLWGKYGVEKRLLQDNFQWVKKNKLKKIYFLCSWCVLMRPNFQQKILQRMQLFPRSINVTSIGL